MTMDVATCIDPQIAAALAASPIGSIDFGTFTFETLPAMRAGHGRHARGRAAADDDRVVRGGRARRHRSRPERARVLAADEGDGATVRLWIHGGGYLFGSGLTVDARLNRWVEEFDCVAVSIEYRLAPEDPYPAPLDDCYAALRWTAQHADELGIDPARIVIAGASAGGGLAAGLAILARDRGEVDVAFQLLIYPMIDDRNTSASSHIDGAPVWSRAANDLGWRAYLGELARDRRHPGDAAPARVESVERTAAGVDRRRFARRLPRRGHRVRVAPVGGRASRPSCTCTPVRATDSR